MRWAALGFVPFCFVSFVVCGSMSTAAADGNRLTYLDSDSPYYVSHTFPKLTTPQWVGDEGVEAVIVLAIDDMRDPQKYEAYLRPILQRLKQIDGRAALSIMTNSIKPDDLQLRSWLDEGLSIEIHTVDHPCPLLQKGDFKKSKSTYDRCVDMMNRIPGNKPVAYRMPCCDSLNTVSPRFYAEIFNRTTPNGNFLSIDTSVFNVFTSDDPEIPRALLFDKDGKPKFKKYVPYDRSFVNTIENYPYPYVINRLCWEFPCVAPSDWSAQHYHNEKCSPKTVRDIKAAIDITVIKKGVLNLVFHPHGWIRNDQIVELIDHAVKKHGPKIKFITFREAQDRLNKNLLGGHPLRDKTGHDNGVRLLDVNNDGYIDVVIGHSSLRQTRVWSSVKKEWSLFDFPTAFVQSNKSLKGFRFFNVHFGFLHKDARPTVIQDQGYLETPEVGIPMPGNVRFGGWHFDGKLWKPVPNMPSLLENDPIHAFRDIDHDGIGEIILSKYLSYKNVILKWSPVTKSWNRLPFTLPTGTTLVSQHDLLHGSWLIRGYGGNSNLRFVDINEDGFDDIVFSNHERYSIHLFESMKTGWSKQILAGKRGDKDPKDELPMIVRKDGTNNGFWVHSRHLWWQNEETAKLKDLVARRSFDDLLKNAPAGPKTPAASLESMVPRPGFKVELVASEPLIADPVAFDWGPDGKLWVVEMADYPVGIDGQGKPGGRIRYLEDTNGDGTYDKSTLFLEGIGFPSGIMPWRKGVLVTAAPDIFYAEDANGDGRADKRETLYTGFGQGNQQHRVNGFSWGLDNWLYCANGDSGGRVKSVKTNKSFNTRRRDIRIRPDTGAIEPELGSTQFGRNRDDWGNWFGNNNSNPMWQYVLTDRYLRRNPHVVSPEGRKQISIKPGPSRCYPVSRTLARFNDLHMADRFTSACGTIVYRDNLFGSGFIGNSFVSEPVHNLVHREVMSAKGVTFTSRRADDEQESEFLASRDNWFRPTMLKVGPDGALYIADMYRKVIEHTQYIPKELQKGLDVRAGDDRGRIYRIVPIGTKRRPIPRFDRMTTTELVAALDSPSGWQRDTVQRLLIHRGDRAAVPLLEKLAGDGKRPQARLHALCTLDGLNKLKANTVVKALSDEHPGVRRHAVRLSESLFGTSEEVGKSVLKLVDDTDPHVRLQLAYSLGYWHDPRAHQALAQLAPSQPAQGNIDDRYIMAAVISSVDKENVESVLTAVLATEHSSKRQTKLVGTLLSLATSLGDRSVLEKVFAKLTASENGSHQTWQFNALAGVLDALARRARIRSTATGEIHASLKQAASGLSQMFSEARKVAEDTSADETRRIAAVRIVGRELKRRKSDIELLAGLLEPRHSGELQSAAVSRLAEMGDKAVPGLLTDRWKSLGPSVRSKVLTALLSRRSWSAALIDALEKGNIGATEIDASRRSLLLAHRDAGVRKRAQKLFNAAANSDRRKVLDAYKPALTMAADRARGKQLFEKTCATCHKLDGAGFDVGPDLASLKDRSPEAMLIAVLDPNRNVESKYINYTAATLSGKIHNGILSAETGRSITLLAPKGERISILRSDLDMLQSTSKSTMPEGLEKDLSVQNLADVIAYVRHVGFKHVPRNQPGRFARGVRPGKDGSLILRANNCEVYGDTLVFETKHDNLGYWKSENDRAIWPISVAHSGLYEVRIEWSCGPDHAGNTFSIECSRKKITHRVKSTGSWNTFKNEKIGTIELSEGAQRLIMQPVGKPSFALMDIKAVYLIPIKKPAD